MIHLLATMMRKLRPRSSVPIAGFGFLFLFVFLYSTIGFKLTEQMAQPGLSWADAAWWSIVTMTTVGYGDIAPITAAGRFAIGYPTLIFGVALIGYFLSVLSTFVLDARLAARKGRKKIMDQNHYLIIRFNTVGNVLKIIQELHKDRATKSSNITLIDEHLSELPQELLSEGVKFVHGDPSSLSTLNKANFTKAKSAIILADLKNPRTSDLQNLAIVLTLESEARHIHTVVECIDPEHITFLEKAGCDSVICLSALAGQMIAQEVLDPGVSEIINELTSNEQGKQFYIVDIPATYKSFGELRQKFSNGRTILAGIRKDDKNIVLPDESLEIGAGDRAVFIADSRPEF